MNKIKKMKYGELIDYLQNIDRISVSQFNDINKLLKEASDNYYNSDKLIMSDEEYDLILSLYRKLGGEWNIGASPKKGKGFVNSKHKYPEMVGTLEKANYILNEDRDKNAIKQNLPTVYNWLKPILKMATSMGKKSIGLSLSYKFDGNSILIEYNKGKVIQALTRGADGNGMDLTHVFKSHKIKSKEHCAIKYEVIIDFNSFDKLLEDTGMSYANPRSLVAGKLSSLDAEKYYPYMTLVPLWVRLDNEILDKDSQLNFIQDNFPEENDCNYIFTNYWVDEEINIKFKDHIYQWIRKFYDDTIEKRENLPFMIDGIVIEIVDEDLKENLGYLVSNDSYVPKWAIALKFPYMTKHSKVIGFDFTMGKLGTITPNVIFEPVTFNGTIHTKQSLQNYKRFNELKLGIGSDIQIEYRNDCLTYITKLDTLNNKNIKPYKFIDECPICGEDLYIDNNTFIYCNNSECKGNLIGRIVNYFEGMNIKGIKDSTIEKLIDNDIITDIISLYNIDYSKVSKIPGLGDLSAISIKSAIENKIPYDYEILGSLAIDGISIGRAKELCKVHNLDEWLTNLYELSDIEFINDVINIEGFSDILAESLMDGLADNQDTIEFLLNRKHVNYLDKFNDSDNEITNNLGINKKYLNIVFTGFRDQSLQIKLELAGHTIKSSVSKKVDLVVCNDKSFKSTKIDKANQLNIPIMDLKEFLSKIKI